MTKSRRENKGELLHSSEARNSYLGVCGGANYCMYPYSVATRGSTKVRCNGAGHSNKSSANSSQGSNREISHKVINLAGYSEGQDSQHGHKQLGIRLLI